LFKQKEKEKLRRRQIQYSIGKNKRRAFGYFSQKYHIKSKKNCWW